MSYDLSRLSRIWLRCAPIGAWNRLDEIVRRLGGAQALWNAFTPAYYQTLGAEAFSLLADLRANRLCHVLRQMEACGVRAVFPEDAEYPDPLRQIPDPPAVLFVQGRLPPGDTPAVAIVGSRRSTRYGSSQARKIAGDLARQGVVVVSGLAKGIDAAAHQGALAAGGATIGVLGSGHAHFYPVENRDLAARMVAQGGAVISEFPPDAPPLPYHFPVRNRIISGLSGGVLLIEAMEKSGTHATINHALSQGREIFALPGNVDAPGSELPLKLLHEGAWLCTCAEDVLSAMRWVVPPPRQCSLLSEAPEEEDDPILAALALEEKTLEELIAETGLDAGEIGTRLTLLELCGQVERRAGRAYARVKA